MNDDWPGTWGIILIALVCTTPGWGIVLFVILEEIGKKRGWK